MLMPFGKYRGYEVDGLPEQYLSWLVNNIQLREPLRSEVISAMRLGTDVVREDTTGTRAIYLEMAKKWHPDHGGTKEAMQAVNEFYERLRG
jgi:hypothetical protein